MRLALFGRGATGRLIAGLAGDEGHDVRRVFTSEDAGSTANGIADALIDVDVAIDFSVAEAVLRNVEACALAKIPLVIGTTGWRAGEAEARRIVERERGAVVYGANFSIGVQIFYRIAARAAELFAQVEGYDIFLEEAHHKRKRDAPSGTALELRDIVAEHFPGELPIASTRAGHIPGTHRIGFDSAADQITLTHKARTREGFARGALVAARWIIGRKGFYEFSEVIDDLTREGKREDAS